MKDLLKIKELCPSAYDFIINKADKAEVGKYELENGAYLMVQEYETKSRLEAKYEAHKRYIDIQMILSGKELIAVTPLGKMEPCDEYNETKDVIHYKHNDECTDYCLTDGDFLILPPELIHMPGVCINEKSFVRKIVVKVPICS